MGQRCQFLCYMDPFRSTAHKMAVCFLQSENSERHKGGGGGKHVGSHSLVIWCDILLFCCILFIRSLSQCPAHTQGKLLYKGINTRRVIIRGHLRGNLPQLPIRIFSHPCLFFCTWCVFLLWLILRLSLVLSNLILICDYVYFLTFLVLGVHWV